jgi:predicted Zn-dependent peptidase
MLTNGKSSILNQSLKENKELVLSVSSGNYSQKDSGIFYIYLTYEPSLEENIESAVIEELKQIQAGNFDEKDLVKAKNQIKTDTYYQRESISNISEDLGYSYIFSNSLNYYENYLKNIDKVTKEDIIHIAKKYLTLDKYALSTIRANNCKPVSNVQQNNNIEKPKLIQELNNTKKVLLPNGATLITKKKKTNSIIAMDISIKGSKALELKPATATLTASASTTGSSNYTNSQFAQFLDENGIKLAVSSGNDSFSIVIQTTKDNLDKAFDALDEVINHPTFQDSEINKIKQRKIQELKSISDNPSSYVFDEFKKLAYKNTIYGQNSTYILNNINNVTREDIVEYYSRIINPENMNIAVVGDVDEDYIAQRLNKIIKKNNKSAKFQFSNQKFNSYKPQQDVETILYKNEVQANWMALGYKTSGALNRRDVAILSVINAIMGEGMSSRLFVNLRENKSLAYTVGSTLSINVLDGAFVTYIGTNKNSIKEAKQGLIEEIERIKSEPVTTKELQDAKDKIMGKFLLGIETNMDEAGLLSWYSTIGRDLNAFEEYKKAICEVSQNDIIEIANKYFNQPHIYTVVMEK